MSLPPVVVTGIGMIAAPGVSVRQAVETMMNGSRRPAPPRRFSVELEKEYVAFEVDAPLEARRGMAFDEGVSRTVRLALAACDEALELAGLTEKDIAATPTGVCLGTTVGCALNNEAFYREFRKGNRPTTEPIENYLRNNPALAVADEYGARGPVAVVSNACASSADAIGLAKRWIETGQCEIAIAGGADELSRTAFLGFISLQNTSQTPCLPFDRNRLGLNLGEGAGVVILESEASAKKRGAAALATLAGYGCAGDGHHPTAPHPEGKGLRRAIAAALGEAAMNGGDIAFASAHGSATPDNDRVEGRALADVMGPDALVTATKSWTGHTLGAAGGIQAVLTVRALIDGVIPPTAGFSEPDPECGVTPNGEAKTFRTKAALSTSLAFGGANAALVFRR